VFVYTRVTLEEWHSRFTLRSLETIDGAVHARGVTIATRKEKKQFARVALGSL
jgi:hypothetical protein